MNQIIWKQQTFFLRLTQLQQNCDQRSLHWTAWCLPARPQLRQDLPTAPPRVTRKGFFRIHIGSEDFSIILYNFPTFFPYTSDVFHLRDLPVSLNTGTPWNFPLMDERDSQ